MADFSCDFRVTRMAFGQSARFFCWVMFFHFLGTREVALRPVASRHVTGLALVCTCFEVASISRFRPGLDFSASAWLRSLGLGGRPRLSSPRLHVASIAFVRCLAQKLSLPSNLPSCLPLLAQKKLSAPRSLDVDAAARAWLSLACLGMRRS